MSDTVRATAADAGCYVEGWWGHYAVAHMIQRAQELGYNDETVTGLAARKLATMYPHDGPELSEDDESNLSDASDDVEAWLNEHAAPEGYAFGWHDGEFYLWSNDDWESAAY